MADFFSMDDEVRAGRLYLDDPNSIEALRRAFWVYLETTLCGDPDDMYPLEPLALDLLNRMPDASFEKIPLTKPGDFRAVLSSVHVEWLDGNVLTPYVEGTKRFEKLNFDPDKLSNPRLDERIHYGRAAGKLLNLVQTEVTAAEARKEASKSARAESQADEILADVDDIEAGAHRMIDDYKKTNE